MKKSNFISYLYTVISTVLTLSLCACSSNTKHNIISETVMEPESQTKTEEQTKEERELKLIENEVKSQWPLAQEAVKNLNKKYNYQNRLAGFRRAKNGAIAHTSENVPFFGMFTPQKGFFIISLKGDTITNFYREHIETYETYNIHHAFDYQENSYVLKAYLDETDKDFKLFDR